MNKSEFVAGLFKRKSIHVVGKADMVNLICDQYRAICNLGKELYCENPTHSFFLNYSQDQLWEWEQERKRRKPVIPSSAQLKIDSPVPDNELGEGMGMGFPKD